MACRKAKSLLSVAKGRIYPSKRSPARQSPLYFRQGMLRVDGACAIFRWNDKMDNAQFSFGVARFSFLVASCNCVSCISNRRAEKISLYRVALNLG